VAKTRVLAHNCNLKNIIPDGKLANHIFSGKVGKYIDTPANRMLISEIVNTPENYLGIDAYGKGWYAKILEDGTQAYGYTQNGIVKGAGYNLQPLNIIKNKGLKK
jgi:hypothetical protein